MIRSFTVGSLVALALIGVSAACAWSQEAQQPNTKPSAETAAGEAPSSGTGAGTAASAPAPAYAAVLKDAKNIQGLIELHQKGDNLYAELTSANYQSEYIVLIAIARGIGQGTLLGGMTWSFGDDWVWQFRKIDERVLVIRKNVRFKADKGSPEESAVRNAYTDSVLFSLPIITKGPKGGDLVDLTPVFMSDLPLISQSLPGFAFAANKSTWAAVKGFTDNVELEVAATYASSGNRDIESVADSRGVTLYVHYSISKIPSTGYAPRMADDRVGYFLTVIKDYSLQSDRERFARYVNRWDLQKADSSAKLSPPKKPIVFWIEKTVPYKYRKPIREGILEWNKAFEQAGFANAIEVRQQPDNADWDPEDINYNTFRWITSSAGFAMGPSHVNPYTGQILDADIIFDADFLTYWKEEFETFTPESIAAMTGGPLEPEGIAGRDTAERITSPKFEECQLGSGMARQLALGSMALIARADPAQSAELLEKLIEQGLKEVTMHEVGHTLGLRHNFKASTWMSLKDMNDPEKTKNGMVASVMDYNPVNIVPKGWQQGDYYAKTIGPYDVWAIQYGYTSLSGGTGGEVKELDKIASRSGEPGLAFTTDEDTIGVDPDPLSNRFDLGDDLVEYAKTREQLMQELMPGLVDRVTKEGDDYMLARRAFNVLFAQYGQSMSFASRYVGGMYTSRSHKGDKEGKSPIEVIDPEKQREVLTMLEEQVFSDKPFRFPPEMYNFLGPSRWNHWGTSPTTRKDFPVHDMIAMWQSRILDQLLSPVTLARIYDTEVKVPADQDAFTTAELIERLTKSIFSEVEHVKKGDFSNRQPAINSVRRNLQRIYLHRLGEMAMGNGGAPEDCQTIAFAELTSLDSRINNLLNSKVKLDSYSKAHLVESSSRIKKVLDARLTLPRP